MAELVKHGDLSVQQISEIKKEVLIGLRKKDTFWDKFCSHETVGDGYSAYEWRKLNIPALTDADIVNLTEGITPDGLALEYVKFKVEPVDYGTYIAYTDKSKKYNFDDVKRDAKVRLSQHAFENGEFRKAKQFISGTCTMDLIGGTNGFFKSLTKARTILKKSHIKPISGNKYGCILTTEQAGEVLLEYKDAITHTSQKEAIINGYIGELNGFILFENTDYPMYKTKAQASAVAAVAGSALANGAKAADGVQYYTRATGGSGHTAGFRKDATYVYTPVDVEIADAGSKYYPLTTEGSDAVASATTIGYCLFVGKTDYGMPVRTVSFGDDSVEVYDNPLGTVIGKDASNNDVSDHIHQRGSVGYKVMGFATTILADEAIIRAEYTLTDGEVSMDVLDSQRTDYVNLSSSPRA